MANIVNNSTLGADSQRTWRPQIFWAPSTNPIIADGLNTYYKAYYEDSEKKGWSEYNILQSGYTYWYGLSRNTRNDKWIAVDGKQGTLPHGTAKGGQGLITEKWIPYPAPSNTYLLKFVAMRVGTPTILNYGFPSGQSPAPICSLGVDVWFDPEPNFNSYLKYFDADLSTPKLLVIDFFANRWMYDLDYKEWIQITYPSGFAEQFLDYGPNDHDFHYIVTRYKLNNPNVRYNIQYDIGSFLNYALERIKSWFIVKEIGTWEPSGAYLRCVAPTIESIGSEFQGYIDDLQVIVP